MNKTKTTIAILASLMILATIITPLFVIDIKAQVQNDPAWYMTVNGVLNSDTYALYPFKTDKSLKWGFSKFGEMINSIDNVGLEYRDRDAFAPAAGAAVPSQILKHKWMQGWFINISYNNPVLGMRNVWAMAQHADLQAYGYDWIRVSHTYTNVTGHPVTDADEDPRDPGLLISNPSATIYRGGRKTNGTAITENIRVLYNGPRRFIARTVTHIFDWTPGGEAENEPLVDIVFTYMFNKDKKEVIVLKDIKEATTKFVFGLLHIPSEVGYPDRQVNAAFIQFSNRGEWDIGPSPPTTPYFASYAHFYGVNGTNTLYTDYDIDYHLNPTLPRNPYSTFGNQPDATGTYDLAQIVSADFTYVGWAAFWPSLSNWHVDAGYQDKWWKSLMRDEDRADRISGTEPWQSPYIIGEWDFMLTKERTDPATAYGYQFDRQFRGVTIYGLSDLHNADDLNAGGIHQNTIDREVLYQVNEELVPWDLKTAVHKDTRRWLQYSEGATTVVLDHTPVVYVSDANWDQYCTFSERVENLETGELLHRIANDPKKGDLKDYSFGYNNATGVATLTGLPEDENCKILYSTDTSWDRTEDIGPYEYEDLNNVVPEQGGTVHFDPSASYKTWTDPLGAQYIVGFDDFDFTATLLNATGSFTHTFSPDEIYGWETDFKVFKESNYTGSWDYEDMVYTSTNVSILFNLLDVHWKINPPEKTDLHVWHLGFGISMDITISYNATTNIMNITTTADLVSPYPYIDFDVLYDETIPGRYEWGVVGNHSRAIDSAGLSMVSAAFKNKQVEYGNGALDVTDRWGPNVPYTLRDFGYTSWRIGQPTYLDWYDSIGRLHIRDDWCTRYAVTSSNIITVAGPMANIMSEYWNELTDAIYIYGVPGEPLLNNVLLAPMCWNTTWASAYLGQNYAGENGLAVITTYKDINGTVGFMIWGYGGDDTYYACKWFHEFGIYYMQHENDGVTTWILRLDYTTHTGDIELGRGPYYFNGAEKVYFDEAIDNNNVDFDNHYPEVWRIERLGTISEKGPHDP